MKKYLDETLTPEERAQDLLSRLGTEEKMAQLVGFNPAQWSKDNFERDYRTGAGQVSLLAGIEQESIREAALLQKHLQTELMKRSKHHIPAIFHVEALCGVLLPGAVSFPSGIGQAATFDPDQQEKMAEMIGREARAAGASQVFAPVLDISRDSRFGRQGETYGEDPTLASAMGVAYIKGLQRNGNLKEGAMATAKHFLGYQAAYGGIHAAACEVTQRQLREIYGKPFQAAISEGRLQSVMPCYGSIDGEPVTASKKIITGLLRQEMGFDGLVVSDYCAISEIHERQMIGETLTEAALKAFEAGVDQELPSKKSYDSGLAEHFNDEGKAVLLDRAVKNILTAKFRMGLFEQPYSAKQEEIDQIYTNKERRKTSLKSALESLVLVKNNGSLPLKKETKKLTVIGYHAASTRALFGGYTYMSMTEGMLDARNTMAGLDMTEDELQTDFSLQKGKYVQTYPGTIVQKEHPDAEGLAKKVLPEGKNLLEELLDYLPETDVTYAYGYDYTGNDCSYHEEALKAAENAEVILLTVGGKYGTGTSASIGEGIDAVDINLSYSQELLIEKLAVLKKPIIIVHFGGRPISSDNADQYAAAILEAWNPGEMGASAIVSVLFGDYNPAGRMPVTTAYCAGQIPVYYNHPHGSSYHQNTLSAFQSYMDCSHEPRYYFGHGLSYTEFLYSNLEINHHRLEPEEALIVSIEITNIGKRDGDEVIQLYIHDCYASMSRPVMELAGFYRVSLRKGESKKVRFSMQLSQFAFLDADMNWKIEAGEMELMLGASSHDIRIRDKFEILRDCCIDGKKRGFYAHAEEIM